MESTVDMWLIVHLNVEEKGGRAWPGSGSRRSTVSEEMHWQPRSAPGPDTPISAWQHSGCAAGACRQRVV